ncbi:ABC transporter permease [Virgibacillus litoralis]|uniref:ABC-2 type transport system permease protein n=1 Tax=Virgibacillus litoralis TaxID=578221 RepID=A0ABS4HB26_9BACI|nr:ABC transporter permease subunit [Virgibacillus litoralis]MBP1948115.1 ABC-2 type transport system permease protein [Virgibacillus litoralis]
MQWMTLFKKELLENIRNLKWIWVPLVMILIATMDPVSSYYLPQIIDAVGGMPEGTEFQLPDFTPSDVVMMSLSQISSIGVLIIVLMSMGTIAGERKSGVSELVLVKPVSYTNYITAKWAAVLLLTLTALALGMLSSWYYVNLLFGELSFGTLLQIIFFYGLWLALVVSLSIFYNTLLKIPGLVAFLTIATILVMKLITTIFSHLLEWSPNNISGYINQMLVSGSVPSELTGAAMVTIVMIILLVASSIYMFKSKEMAN